MTLLEDIRKNICYWLLPEGIQSTIRQLHSNLRSVCLPSAIRQSFTRNKIFHNIHNGERCFILASGPSINRQNLKPLSKEICIAVSEFYLHPDIETISPLYHVEAPNHFPYDFRVVERSHDDYKKYYKENVNFFFGYTSYKYSRFNFLSQHPEYDQQNFYHLNYEYSRLLDESNWCQAKLWDLTKRLFGVNSVIFAAIQVAVYMGFSQIYLVGCDHNHLEDVKRRRTSHFYADDDGMTDDRHEWQTTEQLLYSMHKRWTQYRFIQNFLKQSGQEIINATDGGMLDVFPRVRFEDLF